LFPDSLQTRRDGRAAQRASPANRHFISVPIGVDERLQFLYTGVSDAVAYGRTSLPSSFSNFDQVKGRLETGCSAVLPLQKIP
jgi:hypothetical protein